MLLGTYWASVSGMEVPHNPQTKEPGSRGLDGIGIGGDRILLNPAESQGPVICVLQKVWLQGLESGNFYLEIEHTPCAWCQ